MSKTANELIENYGKSILENQKANQQTSFPNSNNYWDGYYRPYPDYSRCPHCGYCPHCGRGGHYHFQQPYITCGVSSQQSQSQ